MSKEYEFSEEELASLLAEYFDWIEFGKGSTFPISKDMEKLPHRLRWALRFLKEKELIKID